MKEASDSLSFYKDLKIFMLASLVIGTLMVSVLFWNMTTILSFLIGGILGYINFSTLRREGKDLLFKVYRNVMNCVEKPYQRERTIFLVKVYLRLLALGIIFYFLLVKAKLSAVWLILGFTVVYFQIFLVTLKYWIRKRESFLIK